MKRRHLGELSCSFGMLMLCLAVRPGLAQQSDDAVQPSCALHGIVASIPYSSNVSLRFDTLIHTPSNTSGGVSVSPRTPGSDGTFFTADDSVGTLAGVTLERAELAAPGVIVGSTGSGVSLVRNGNDMLWGTADDIVTSVESALWSGFRLWPVNDRTVVWSSSNSAGRLFRYCNVELPTSSAGACAPGKYYSIQLPAFALNQMNADAPVGFSLPGVVGVGFLYAQAGISWAMAYSFPAGASFVMNGGPHSVVFPPSNVPPYSMVWSMVPGDHIIYRDWLPNAKWQLGSFADIANVNGRLPLFPGVVGDVESVVVSDEPGSFGIPSVISVLTVPGYARRLEYVPALAQGVPNARLPLLAGTSLPSGGGYAISGRHVIALLYGASQNGWGYWVCG